MVGEIISSDRLLKKEENSEIATGEVVQNTDNGNAEWPSELHCNVILMILKDKVTLN